MIYVLILLQVMELRVAIICIILTATKADNSRYYKTELSSHEGIDDQAGEKTENRGFVEPIDFSSFTQQFFQGGAQNFASLPFTANGGFDFFGAESKNNQFQLPGNAVKFPPSPFQEEKQNNTGFVQPVNFASAFDGEASPSSAIYRPEFYAPPVRSTLPSARPTDAVSEEEEFQEERSTRSRLPSTQPPKRDYYRGKSNYPAPRSGHKSDHAPTAAVYANSEDVEVFYPPGRAILPQINGRPKPYDGYRAASDENGRIYQKPKYKPRPKSYDYDEEPSEARYQTAATRQQPTKEDVEEVEDEEEEEEETPKKAGYRYQYDSSINVPDLVIRKYPYEKADDNDEEFTHDYEQYKQSLPSNLEKHFGTPDYKIEQYTVAATENLEKDKNCEKVQPRGKRQNGEVAQTCYICRNPKTGGSYEQCAYQDEPKSNKYFYGGSTSSSSQTENKPVVYRHKRSTDFFQPSSYEYFIYNEEPDFKRKARAETFIKPGVITPTKPPKRKTKKYATQKLKKKNPKRKIRQEKVYDPSSEIDGPPYSYSGPKYTYEGPKRPYEGPADPYEGPTAAYEGPSSPYEGPDHDDYYDRTDDRIPYETNPPLLSTFFDDSRETKKRPRRGPKTDVEEFIPGSSYLSDYRFGSEFFDDEGGVEERPEPAKRDVEIPIEKFISGNVKIFKNGDVCEKMKKESMVCMVCENDKTGAKYEQCEYSTKPKQKAYRYGSQKSFSSEKGDKNRPQRHLKDQEPEISDKVEKRYMITKVESMKTFNEDSEEPLISSASNISPVRAERETAEEAESEEENENEAQAEAEEEETAEELNDEDEENEEGDGKKVTETSEKVDARDNIEGLDEFLGKQKTTNGPNYPQNHESFDEYFKRVFPEFETYKVVTPDNFDPFSQLEELKDFDLDSSKDRVNYEESESKSNPTRLKDKGSSLPAQFFANDDESKKDLQEAFASFQKRDWSKCKKIQKDKLTCYECLNKDGISNEECMYVEESEPKSSHLAYHEKKDYDPAASHVINAHEINGNLTAISNENDIAESKNQDEAITEKSKGDFEGTEPPKKSRKYQIKRIKTDENEKTTDPPVKKVKYPVKKYPREEQIELEQETSWESTKEPKVDESVVKIYFNNTGDATKS